MSSWKKYGGINKLDKMNFLNVNSISTDKLTLREAYVGAFDICGNITVSENFSVNGITDLSYIHIRNNVDVSKNVVIQGNVLVKGNTIFTSTQSTFTEKLYFGSDNKQFFYGDPSGIGINIENPNATLDICGNRVEAFNVFTDSSTNRNIIARNMNHKGIVVHVDNSNSTIDFFNDVSINRINTYDGRIQYQKGGSLIIDVSDNTYVASKFAVSNRDASSHVMRETAVIYDICNNTYAYNVYDISSANTGNALSLIASDNSSNTFLNIVTPGKNGLSIGGGAYPLDRKKAMGTIGLYDASADVYRPTQNIVRGSSSVKYKTTLGINTYAPRIDKYVVDINGPIHLTNGELTNVSSNNFEFKNIVFSRTNKDFGIAFGSPYSILSGSCKQKILYTKNGGKSWSESRIVDSFDQINHTTDLENQEIYFYSGYIYNQSYSIIGGDRNYLFYSNDGGEKWNNIAIANDVGLSTLPVIGVYIGERDNPVSDYKRVVLLYYNKFTSFDITLSTLDTNMTANNTIIITNNDIRSITDGNQCNYMHGYGNYVYMVGTKISKYNITNNSFVSSATHDGISGSSREYNSVYAYDDNYVIAVGDKIISYTKDGGSNWTDISINTTDLAIQSMILQSVYILDANNAMAVGNSGIIIYTTDGSVTWKTAANDVMNSSGNGNRLVNSNYNLNGIVMQDINSFIVSTLIRLHSQNQEPGKTNIMYCFLPNLMNRNNNYVFDMSGNMGVDGDIRINSGRILIDSSNNVDVNSIDGALQITKGGAYIYGNLKIDGSILANGGIKSTSKTEYSEVANFTSGIKTDVTSTRRDGSGAVVISNGGGLYVTNGNTYIGGKMDVSENLIVFGDIYAMNGLQVTGNFNPNKIIIQTNIEPSTDNNTDGALIVRNGGAYIRGNTYIDRDLVLSRNATINGTITISGSSSLNNLNISGVTTMNNNLNISGVTTMNNNLNISGISYLNNVTDSASVDSGSLVVKGGVGIAKNINVGGVANIKGFTTIGNAIINTPSIDINSGALVVNGGVGISGTSYIGGITNFTNNTPSNAVGNGALIVTGGVSIGGNSYIGGITNFTNNTPSNAVGNGALIVTGGVSIGGNSYIGGITKFTNNTPSNEVGNGALVVTGTGGIGVGGNVNIGGIATVTNNIASSAVGNGALIVTGGVSIGGNSYIGGITKFTNNTPSNEVGNGALVVTGTGGIGVGGNVNIGGIATVTNNIASSAVGNGALIVTGGVSIGGNSYIGGITNFTNNTPSNAVGNGALVVTGTGGIGVGGNVNIGGIATVTNNTASSAVGDGALIVTGGVGIAKNINVGTTANIAGITRITGGTASTTTTTGALIVTGGVGISGNVNATSFNATSDYRIKKNVKRLDNSFSLDKLEPICYYNTLTKRDDIGFIAHKVQELYPYLVNGEKDSPDYQTLNYIGLIGILVREVQELKRTVDELKSR